VRRAFLFLLAACFGFPIASPVLAGRVPQSVIVIIDGAPREISLTPRLTVMNALRAVNPQLDKRPVYLERHKAAQRVDVDRILAGHVHDISLQDADVLIIGHDTHVDR
jgi:hypothetical protein